MPGISHTHSEKNGRIAAIVLEKGVTPRDITNQPHLALRILEGSIGDNWPRLLTPHDSN
ncbi:hypothetical protein H6768_02155 [Candidatus Peribacteria bacterium]|nr:hypothetical protein [Candidatus Peribacteria bacterium]